MVSGRYVRCLVEAQIRPGIENVIAPSQVLMEMIVQLTAQLTLKPKDAMKIHAQVTHSFSIFIKIHVSYNL